MNNNVAGWIGGVLIIVNVIGMVIANAVKLVKAIQCRKVKYPCENMMCKTRHLCDKYDNTKEILNLRIALLEKQISEMEKRCN